MSLLVVVGFLLLSALGAQSPEDGLLITVNVDVTDARGRPIVGLTADDFQIYEDDRPQTLTAFESETDLPLTVALVGDASASSASEIRFVQEAASGILQSLMTSPADRGLVVGYGSYPRSDTRVTLIAAPTNDRPRLLDIADRFPTSLGQSAMHSALVLAARLLAPLDGRRVIVLIGAGVDNTPRFGLEDSLLAAHQAGATVYTVRANSRLPAHMQILGLTPLRRLAEETGGQAFMERSLGALDEFDQIGRSLRSRYRLTYRPTDARPGGFHRIRVETPVREAAVRTVSGYAAVPYREFEVNFNVDRRVDVPEAIGLAARGGDLVRVRELIDAGVGLDVRDDAGKTPLYLASQNGHEEVVLALLGAGAQTDRASLAGITPLIVATVGGSENIVRRLIAGGAEVDHMTPDGVTALLAASAGGDDDLVDTLLDSGARVDLPSSDGVTPLIAAAARGHTRVVRRLLDNGADFTRTNADGMTALEVARLNGREDVAELLTAFAARR